MWRPPLEGVIKANSDASYDESRNLCSIGVILRDDQAMVQYGSGKILPALSPLHAKSLAMKEAHFLASNWEPN